MIKALGFEYVAEVSFGADLVADRYKKLVSENKNFYISSDCPSIVNYVKFYHPALVDNLAPVVSPMVAMSRVIREKYGKDTRIVFIGPCIAKKAESTEIDEAITFTELREMFWQKEVLLPRILTRLILISRLAEEELFSLLPAVCFRQPKSVIMPLPEILLLLKEGLIFREH